MLDGDAEEDDSSRRQKLDVDALLQSLEEQLRSGKSGNIFDPGNIDDQIEKCLQMVK